MMLAVQQAVHTAISCALQATNVSDIAGTAAVLLNGNVSFPAHLIQRFCAQADSRTCCNNLFECV